MRAVMRTSAGFTLLIAGVLGQYSVHQDPYMTVTEGEDVQINCNYTGTEYSLQWYQHISAHKIQPVLLLRTNGYNSLGRFTIFLNIDEKFTYLYVNRTQVEDSAVYYCAMEGNNAGWKTIFGAGTELTVLPKTTRTIPSVYQLKSYKPETDLPNTVCLITDFPSPQTTLVDGKEIPINDTAVLDKSSNDKWRYSAVVWDNDAESPSCTVTYGDQSVKAEVTIDEMTETCSTLTVNERFQTNPVMNTLSTTTLGLRILTAKAIVFNLIITLRLWSS